jgi:hypothetical protein
MNTEGSPWDSAESALLVSSRASLTYDLGAAVRVRGALIQADNNDTFELAYSLDGQTFSSLWHIPNDPEAGQQTRDHQALDTQARYLRLSVNHGDGFYSVTELAAYCDPPAPWPPALPTPLGHTTHPGWEQHECWAPLRSFSRSW